MAQLPGEIAVQDLKTGEVYYGPPGTPFDRARFKVVAGPGDTPDAALEQPQPGPMPLPGEAPMFGPPQNTQQAMVRQALAPSVGGAIGGLLGPVGAVAGAAGGEALNQYGPDAYRRFVGLEGQEPRPAAVGLAGAVPAALSGVRRFFTSLPGAATGLQDWVFSKLGAQGEKLVSKFAPVPGTASKLFAAASKEAGQSGLVVNTAAFGRAVQSLEGEVGKIKFRPESSLRLLADAKEFLQGTVPAGMRATARRIPFDEFRTNQAQLGRVIRNLESTEGVELGQAKKLYAAMWDDLDAAAAKTTGKAGATLKSAIEAYKREQAADDIRDFLVKSVSDKVGRPALNVDGLSTKIARNADYLEKKLPADEVQDLLRTVRKFSSVPVPSGTNTLGFGGTGFAERAVVGAVGGAAAEGLGFGTGGILGGAAGGVMFVEALSIALSTPPGRAMVRLMADQGMSWHQISAALLEGGAQVGRSWLMNPPQPRAPAQPEVRDLRGLPTR